MLKKLLKISIILFLLFFIIIILTINLPQFGKNPESNQLKIFEKSSNFFHGEFKNLQETPVLKKDETSFKIFWNDFFSEKKQTTPQNQIPTMKTNLKQLDITQDVVIWLGHSSFYVQLAGKRILIDPVFNQYASPFPFIIKAFPGTNIYTSDEIPKIDYLLISHDHYDHLDYQTIMKLKNNVEHVIIPLGVGSHFKYWGYKTSQIHEFDWFEKEIVSAELNIHVLPARHYSGRALAKNKTLWASYLIESNEFKLYFSGDTGYGPHFKEIQKKFKTFDFAMLDSGQYDTRWPFIHMTPEEAVQAAIDLHTQNYFPIHIGKFSLSSHAWNDPFKRIEKLSKNSQLPNFVTPMIGEPIFLKEKKKTTNLWWNDK